MSLRFQYGTSWSARATANDPIPRPSSPLQQELAAPTPPELAAFEVVGIQVSGDGIDWSNLATDRDRSRTLQARPVWQPRPEPQLFVRAVRPPVQASASQRYNL